MMKSQKTQIKRTRCDPSLKHTKCVCLCVWHTFVLGCFVIFAGDFTGLQWMNGSRVLEKPQLMFTNDLCDAPDLSLSRHQHTDGAEPQKRGCLRLGMNSNNLNCHLPQWKTHRLKSRMIIQLVWIAKWVSSLIWPFTYFFLIKGSKTNCFTMSTVQLNTPIKPVACRVNK